MGRATITLRLSPNERELLERAARVTGDPARTFARAAIVEAAQRVLRDLEVEAQPEPKRRLRFTRPRPEPEPQPEPVPDVPARERVRTHESYAAYVAARDGGIPRGGLPR
ncbi:MAG TPA: DUF1778 domain-containing protein [Gaiellaceae bacterium]|nr:DUF1778 domain-containing protein [Gaiellaceae bacterium]